MKSDQVKELNQRIKLIFCTILLDIEFLAYSGGY